MKQLMQNTRDFGKACEGAACDYLLKKGYKIKERNFTVKGGEIDIVAEDGDYIVFVEVKARRQGYDVSKYGRPSDAVNEAKKAHFRSAVREYLYKKGSRKSRESTLLKYTSATMGMLFQWILSIISPLFKV